MLGEPYGQCKLSLSLQLGLVDMGQLVVIFSVLYDTNIHHFLEHEEDIVELVDMQIL